MRRSSTTQKIAGLRILLFFILGGLLSPNGSFAQIVPVYADSNTISSHVMNPSNATNSNLNDYATLESYGGIAIGIGAYTGELELKFPTALPSETTSYVKIDFDPALLDALLGGELGDGLAGLLGSVVLGDHFFNVEARLGGVTVLSGSSKDEFDSDRLRLIVNSAGDYLLAITPDKAYDRIYIEDQTNALLLGTTNSMDVYYAYYNTGQDPCEAAFATSFNGSGGTLDALGLGNAGVENPENAIDSDPNTFSELSQGLLTVAGSISQTVYFESLSNSDDQYHISLKTDDPALLNLGLIDGVRIQAFDGTTMVSEVALSSLLDLDLLGLLSSGNKGTVSFSPGVPFDRVRITISSLVQLNLVKNLEIYEVYRSPASPLVPLDDQIVNICTGETADLTASTDAANELVWYDTEFGGTPLATTAFNGTFTTPALTSNETYYVAAKRTGCAWESSRVEVNVLVHPIPSAPAVVDNSIEVNTGGTAMMEVQNPENHIVYEWYDAPSGGNLVHTGDTYIVTGITSPVDYYVEAKVGDSCVSSNRTQVSITISSSLLPPTVTPPVLTITEGQSGTFTATTDNTTPNLEFEWYDSGGTLIHTGPTFQTPHTLPVGTYTFDVVLHDPATGTSSAPTTITLHIVPVGAISNCSIANAQANGINPVCLSCGVEDAENAVDGDSDTYARFVAPAALLGGGVYQELIFPTPGMLGDTISIKIGTGNSLLDVNVLQEVTFESYNGTNANGDGTSSGGLLNLELLPGTNIGEINFVAGGNFDRVRIEYSPLIGLLDSGLRVYQANINFPNPTLVSTDLNICVGESADLEVTPSSGTSINWYDVETGGTSLGSGNTFTTPIQMIPGVVTYYAAIVRNSCEDDERFAVNVNVFDIPAAPQVIDSTVEVNPGGTANLEVSNPQAHITYKWYDAMSGGNLMHTGATFTVPNITSAPLIYYVEASIGDNCASLTRTMVTISITNTLLPPVVAPPVLIVTEGQSGTFTASTSDTDPNLEIQWYDENGVLVFTGTVYQTPDTLPVGTYTYDVVVHDPVTGNTSAPTTVTLNVVPPGSLSNCTIANAQTNGTNFLCVACGVENPGNAVDGDINTYSRFIAPAAALGGGVYQDLIFPTPGMAGDTISIKIGTGNSLLDLNLLQEISFESYNGSTPNGDGTAVSGLLNLELLPGTNIGFVSFVAGAAFDRVKIEYSPVVGLLDSGLRIYQADIDFPDPTLITDDVKICVGETATLEVTPPAGTTIHWYDVPSGGTPLATGNTFTTPVQNNVGTITYYAASERNACEDDERLPVNVEVYSTPSAPLVVDNSIVVNPGGTATMQIANPIAHVTYNWYDAATGGNLLHTGTVFSVPNIMTAVDYYVEAAVGDSCTSASRTMISITITNDLLPPTVVPPVLTITVGQSGTFTASTNNPGLPNLEIHWFDQSATQVFNGTVYNTSTALPVGTYTYDVVVYDPATSNTSGPTTVTLNVVPPNSISDCTEADSQTNGVNPICVLCGVENPENAVDGNPNTYSRFVAPVAALGGGVYQELIFQEPGFAGDTITIKIGTGNSLLDLNVLQEVTFESYNGSIANGDGNTIGGLIDLDLLPGTNIGEVSFIAAASFDRVRIQYSPLVGLLDSGLRIYEAEISFPGPTSLSDNVEICIGQSATLTAVPAPGTTLQWYDVATGGTPVATGNFYTTPVFNTAGTYSYYLAISRAGCEDPDRIPVEVKVLEPGTPTSNDLTQDFCAADNPTVADIQVNETNVLFYDAATGGNIVPPTTALVDGTTYYVSLDVAGCESAVRLAITVNVDDAGTPTTTDPNQTFCVVDNPVVGDIQVNEANVTFYDAPTGGNVVIASTALIDGTTYYASLSNPANGCESSVRLAITVNVEDGQTPTTNDTTQDFCAADMPTVGDIQVDQSGVTFYDALTGGTAYASTDPLTDGTTYYASLTDPASGCESSVRLAITVNINEAATPTTLDDTPLFCAADSPTVGDIQVNETGITFYDSASGGTAYANTDPLMDGTTYYASLTDPANGCESSVRLAITVTVGDAPTPTTTDTTQDFCTAVTPTVGDLQVNEPNVTFYDAASGGTAYASTDLLVDGNVYYASLTDPATGCESSVRLAITVMLNSGGTPTTTDDTQDFCLSDNPTVADIQVNESNVVWYDVPTGGTILASTTPLIDGATYYAGFDPASNCPTITRLAVTVNIEDPLPPTTTESTQEFCVNIAPTIADIQVNETGVVWYDVPTGGTPLSATTLLVDGTTYYGSYTDPVSGCESSVRLAVDIIITQGLDAFINGPLTNVCAFEEVTYTTNSGMTNYVWNVTGGNITNGGGTADDFVSVSWTNVGGTNTVDVSFTDPTGCTAVTTANVTVQVVNCADLTITKEVDNPTPMIRENVTFSISVTNNGNTQFSNLVIKDVLPSGYEYVSSMTSTGTYSSISGIWGISTLGPLETATMELTAKVLGDGDYLNIVIIESSVPLDTDLTNNQAEASVDPICLTVYNEFSPNNDGANDFFVIDCIEQYPDNELRIYNRYGSLVYKKKSYDNSWDGRPTEGTLFESDKVPEATYFYVIELKSENKVLKGWLYLTR